ncbi:uncharacterized protein [Chelonus insularis]|uniref:uncharacterized protein n=1 Tax=Chelonus insularis TaxID=460826 RepID=UPI00158846B2|nr:uncharacterized protein LOC118064412 [Chelonus insularis]
MDCEVFKKLFTTNLCIDNYQRQDSTIQICGYVDSIEGITKIVHKTMWSLILNNNQGRRVRVIFFEELATIYSQLIHHRSIVTLNNAYCRKCHNTYGILQENLHQVELVARSSTKISLSSIIFDMIQPLECQMIDVFRKYSIKYITGYVKSNFTLIENRKSSYQSGVVTDGRFEVNVRIFDHKINPNIKIGKLLIFLAESQVDNRDYSSYLAVPKMSDIRVLDFTMSIENLELGILAPPRNLF